MQRACCTRTRQRHGFAVHLANSGTPLIVTAGQQEQGHGLTEPLLYAPLVPIATPVVKWATEVTRLEDLPRIVHRAAKVATTAPTGPVFISLPGDILNMRLRSTWRTNAGRHRGAPARRRPRALARRLLDAKRPVILAGHEIATSDAFAEAAAFAETLGAPVCSRPWRWGAHFPSEHPAYLGPLSRDQKTVRGRLSDFDTVISLGSDLLRMSVYSGVEPLPHTEVSIDRIARLGDGQELSGRDRVARRHQGDTARVTPLIAELGGATQAPRRPRRRSPSRGPQLDRHRAAREAKLASAKRGATDRLRIG